MVHDTGAAEHVAGDDLLMEVMLDKLSVGLISRQLQLTPEAAEACSEIMFMRRTGGPHPSQTLPVANHLTFEEIVIVTSARAISLHGTTWRRVVGVLCVQLQCGGECPTLL